uniref:Retrovirus-related Pol polyprotein from transposon TNT 1-94 n=1 Tax=Cajanus cajan TaxID=3821 RepID=A0A151T854_CAJCA|nr:hypothetical protein KK1_017806 [Cajanus cajan]
MLMENFLHSKEYWGLIENVIFVVTDGAESIEAQLKLIDEQRLKDLKVKNYLFQAIDRDVLEAILRSNGRTLTIANKMKAQGESMNETTITKKILRSMVSKFNYAMCSIEESNNLDMKTIDELQSNLLVYEQRMRGHGEEGRFQIFPMITEQQEQEVEVHSEEDEAEEGEDNPLTKLLLSVSNVTS